MNNFVIRWSGLILLIGAALMGSAVITVALNPAPTSQPLSPFTSLLFMIATPFLLLSLPGMYARQADAAGVLGLVGFVLLQTGVIMLPIIGSATLIWPSAMTMPTESRVLEILGIALTLGSFLTGLATLRARVFPRVAGIIMIVASLGFLTGSNIGFAVEFFLLAVALAWIGVSTWIGHKQQLAASAKRFYHSSSQVRGS